MRKTVCLAIATLLKTIGNKGVNDGLAISHRMLSEEEAYTIWAAINSSPVQLDTQEVRIILRPKGGSQVTGWIVRTDMKDQSYPLPNGF